jgi:hypothetical protein
LGAITPREAEVTYINWIPEMPIWDFFRPSEAALTSSPEIGDHPAQQNWVANYPFRPIAGPEGILAVQCGPATRLQTQESGHQFALTVRSPLETVETLGERMATARNVIVQTFTDLTTHAAQVAWERISG